MKIRVIISIATFFLLTIFLAAPNAMAGACKEIMESTCKPACAAKKPAEQRSCMQECRASKCPESTKNRKGDKKTPKKSDKAGTQAKKN